MKNRTLTVSALAAASLGLGLAAASGAVAHPGGHGGEAAGQGVAAQSGSEARQGRRAARGRFGPRGRRAAACEIATDKLLTAENNSGLQRLKERLDERVADGDITQERADRVFARRQKMITIRVEKRSALIQPTLTLFGVDSRADLRQAVKDAGGMAELLESKNLDRSDVRDARRQGRQDARAAVRELCSSGEDADEGTTEQAPSV